MLTVIPIASLAGNTGVMREGQNSQVAMGFHGKGKKNDYLSFQLWRKELFCPQRTIYIDLPLSL